MYRNQDANYSAIRGLLGSRNRSPPSSGPTNIIGQVGCHAPRLRGHGTRLSATKTNYNNRLGGAWEREWERGSICPTAAAVRGCIECLAP